MARGVRAIRLDEGDIVVGASVVKEGTRLLVVSENGYGKKTELDEYHVQNRGGKGVLTYRITGADGAALRVSVRSQTRTILCSSPMQA